ncbi:MAG: hypothetical protein ABFD83_13780 [Armatimonadota bacterium]
MARLSEDWKNCINDLLREFGCASGWSAEEFTQGALSHGYISRMMQKGVIPQWDSAVKFLSYFRSTDHGKALTCSCLRAANYPIPTEWQEKLDIDTRYARAWLILEPSTKNLSETRIEKIKASLRQVIEEQDNII